MKRRRRNLEEERIHRAVADWLRAMGVYFTHVPNEEQNELQRKIKSALGTLPGVADIVIFDPPSIGGGAGAALEIKAPGKKPTEAQYRFLHEMRLRNWATNWSDDLDDALAWLRSLGYGRRERMAPPASRQRGQDQTTSASGGAGDRPGRRAASLPEHDDRSTTADRPPQPKRSR